LSFCTFSYFSPFHESDIFGAMGLFGLRPYCNREEDDDMCGGSPLILVFVIIVTGVFCNSRRGDYTG